MIIKRLICKLVGHKFTVYPKQLGYYSYDVEKAGYCKRCGFDTHGKQ